MTLNPYIYVKDNPVNLVDPTGKWQKGDEKLPKEIQDRIKQLTIDYLIGDGSIDTVKYNMVNSRQRWI